MKNFFLTILVLFVSLNIIAQPGWNWPENKSEAEEKNVLYTDYLKQQNCDQAKIHLDLIG